MLQRMVLPVRDDNRTRRRAVVTFLLVSLNVVLFLIEPVRGSVVATDQLRAECTTQAFLFRWAAIPHELVTDRQTERVVLGPVGDRCLVGPPTYVKSPVLSVLSAMFLHGGWLHLLGNMLFLWIFGNNVEDRLNRVRYLVFYVFCGFVAAYAFALTYPTSLSPLIGASGAIAGVLGAYLALFPRARVTTLVVIVPVRMPAWLVLGAWFVLQWWYSSQQALSSGVAYVAHVYGFVTGLAIGLVVRARDARRPSALW
jgi:membrane associated rhomboid family serine protease